MSVPSVRRIVVGVDGSAESAAALRWACREASLRGAEVHAVHAREAPCHSMASYAVPAQGRPHDVDVDVMWRSVISDQLPGVQVRTEVADGLAARILLERCEEADMLVLGTASDTPGGLRSAGPVIRACLRRAPCPVVVISAAQEPRPDWEAAARSDDMAVAVQVPAGARVPAGAAVSASAGAPASPSAAVPAGSRG
jgi:nucleotide-binding universal stress UspA family protein